MTLSTEHNGTSPPNNILAMLNALPNHEAQDKATPTAAPKPLGDALVSLPSKSAPAIDCTPSKEFIRAQKVLGSRIQLNFNAGLIPLSDLEADFDALVKLEKEHAILNTLKSPIERAALEQCKQAIVSALDAHLNALNEPIKTAEANARIQAEYDTLIQKYGAEFKDSLNPEFLANQTQLNLLQDKIQEQSAELKTATTSLLALRQQTPFFTAIAHKLRALFRLPSTEHHDIVAADKKLKHLSTSIQILKTEKETIQKRQTDTLQNNIKQLSDLYKANSNTTENDVKKSMLTRFTDAASDLYHRLRNTPAHNQAKYTAVNELPTEELERLSDYIQEIENFKRHLEVAYGLKTDAETKKQNQSRLVKFLTKMGFFFLLAIGLCVDGGASYLGTFAFFSLIPNILDIAVQALSATFSSFNCVLFVAFEGSMLQDYFGISLFGKAEKDVLNAQTKEINATTQINSLLLNNPQLSASLAPHHIEHYARFTAKLNQNAARIKDNFVMPVESTIRRNNRYFITGFGAFMFSTWAYYATYTSLEAAFALSPLSPISIIISAVVIVASLAYFAAMQAKGVHEMINPTMEISEKLRDTEFDKKEKLDFDHALSPTPTKPANDAIASNHGVHLAQQQAVVVETKNDTITTERCPSPSYNKTDATTEEKNEESTEKKLGTPKNTKQAGFFAPAEESAKTTNNSTTIELRRRKSI